LPQRKKMRYVYSIRIKITKVYRGSIDILTSKAVIPSADSIRFEVEKI
jgi:hypothetical protein